MERVIVAQTLSYFSTGYSFWRKKEQKVGKYDIECKRKCLPLQQKMEEKYGKI